MDYSSFVFVILISFSQFTLELSLDELREAQIKHRPIEIPANLLSRAAITLSDQDHLKNTIKEILIPRVVGTKGHDKVRDFIVNSMKDLNWVVESDVFEDDTPNMGRLKFENIIATLNPGAERFLVLACHYDSKYFKEFEFLGATDSAVPCGMLINLAYVLNKEFHQLEKIHNDVSLKLVFFDGEEAFHQWSPKDSIYGARHLAQKWEKGNFLPRIDVLVLLDLIGAPDPIFYSFFAETTRLYTRFLDAEERLAAGNFLAQYASSGPSTGKAFTNRYFQQRSAHSYIEDDHLPFLNRQVPILHLIPVPFPDFWHTKEDDETAIDYTTVENLNKILRVFVIEYLKLDI